MRSKIKHRTHQFRVVAVAVAVVVAVVSVVIVLSSLVPKITGSYNKLSNSRHFKRVKRVNPNVLISLLED